MPFCGHAGFHAVHGFDREDRKPLLGRIGIDGDKSLWSICSNCGFLFQNPRPSPEKIIEIYESGLYREKKIYPDSFFKTKYERPLAHLDWASAKGLFLKDGRILDVGAGHGGAVKAFSDRGCDSAGIELDRNLCEEAKSRFGVNLIQCGIMEYEGEAGSFDMIYSSHVHEHLDDFQSANMKLAGLLKPGGHMLCVLPTCRMAGRNGRGFINAMHNSIFTKTSLWNMFVNCGLEPVSFKYPLSPLAELWGLARKPLDGSKVSSSMKKDSPLFVKYELMVSPPSFDFIYALRRYAVLAKRFLMGEIGNGS